MSFVRERFPVVLGKVLNNFGLSGQEDGSNTSSEGKTKPKTRTQRRRQQRERKKYLDRIKQHMQYDDVLPRPTHSAYEMEGSSSSAETENIADLHAPQDMQSCREPVSPWWSPNLFASDIDGVKQVPDCRSFQENGPKKQSAFTLEDAKVLWESDVTSFDVSKPLAPVDVFEDPDIVSSGIFPLPLSVEEILASYVSEGKARVSPTFTPSTVSSNRLNRAECPFTSPVAQKPLQSSDYFGLENPFVPANSRDMGIFYESHESNRFHGALAASSMRNFFDDHDCVQYGPPTAFLSSPCSYSRQPHKAGRFPLEQPTDSLHCTGQATYLVDDKENQIANERLASDFLYKTQWCMDILKEQSCPRGNCCTFAHTAEELRKKEPYCKEFAHLGTCSRKKCKYAHIIYPKKK